MHFSVRMRLHMCAHALQHFCERAPDFQSVPGSLLARWCQFQSLSVISGHSPAPPAHSAVGHGSRGEIRSVRGLQHLNLSGRSSGGWGGVAGCYRLLSNALLQGQIRRFYLWKPQGVEEKKKELAKENKIHAEPCNHSCNMQMRTTNYLPRFIDDMILPSYSVYCKHNIQYYYAEPLP